MADTNTNHPRILLILGLLGLVTAGPLGCIEGESSTDQDVHLRTTTGESTGPYETTDPYPNNCSDECSFSFMDVGVPTDASYRCYCPSTWYHLGAHGTDIYRGDSDICTAAIHRGAIDSSGGFVEVIARGGMPYYTGSLRNGVETGDAGSFSKSFEVHGTTCP